MKAVHDQFLALVPQETYPPQSEQGETRITFTIASSGSLLSMQLDGTSPDDILAKSAWTSIRKIQHPPLPAGFRGSDLVLNMRFVSNK
jgi:outer membrane biosynthesis protein TonB